MVTVEQEAAVCSIFGVHCYRSKQHSIVAIKAKTVVSTTCPPEGFSVGQTKSTGAPVGAAEGSNVVGYGVVVGCAVGDQLGASEATMVGNPDGDSLGMAVS